VQAVPVLETATEMRVTGVITEMPESWKVPMAPREEVIFSVPEKAPSVVGVAVSGSRQSVVPSVFIGLHAAVPTAKVEAPAVMA
jgi:hypothetical protein